jgi:hypothetical protein
LVVDGQVFMQRLAGVQLAEPPVLFVVLGHAVAGVFGVVDRVRDELAHVVVLDAIEDLVRLPSRGDQPGESQLRQVLRDRRRRLVGQFSQFVDRPLLVEQPPQQSHAGRVGEHPKDFSRKLELLPFGKRPILCVPASMRRCYVNC